MPIARRPIFIPSLSFPYVQQMIVEFEWFSGFSLPQIQRNVRALHFAANLKGVAPILEVSSKSPEQLGVALSAFNLCLQMQDGAKISVECAFQGSKVFEKGGPYTDLYNVRSGDAKKDRRLRNSGNIVAFEYMGETFPTKPETAFYDWLYLKALWQNTHLHSDILNYNAFSDIVFNPAKSLNCQARSVALFVTFYQTCVISEILRDKEHYLAYISSPQALIRNQSTYQLSLF